MNSWFESTALRPELLDFAHFDLAAIEVGAEQAQAAARLVTSSIGVVLANNRILCATWAVESSLLPVHDIVVAIAQPWS
jgi:hypothetical protein